MFSEETKAPARNADPITLAFFRSCFHRKQKPLLGTLTRSPWLFLGHVSMIVYHPSMVIHHPSPITHHPSGIRHQASSIIHDPSSIIHYGVIWGSFLNHSGIILVSFWGHIGSSCDHIGKTLGSFLDHFGIAFGVMLGSFLAVRTGRSPERGGRQNGQTLARTAPARSAPDRKPDWRSRQVGQNARTARTPERQIDNSLPGR